MHTTHACWLPAIALLAACGDTAVGEPLPLPACSSSDSPRELMRIADSDNAITSLEVHDLDQAVSAAFILYGESSSTIAAATLSDCAGPSASAPG